MIKFLNCQINLSKKVFEPRIETEFWVGKAIKEIRNWKIENRNLEALDLFAGTGCIGIAVLRACPEGFGRAQPRTFVRRVDFADMSKEAIEQIKINLKLNKISPKRYEIYKSNLFEKLKGKRYDVVFANPPYVAFDRIREVQKEVLEKEPKETLFAGRNGIFWIEKFLKEIKKYLKKDGVFYMEFDPRQKEKIKEILKKEGFKFTFRKDQFKKFRWLKAMY